MARTFMRSATRVVLATGVLVLIIPPLVFLIVGLHSGMAPGDAVSALGAQYAAKRVNMAVISALNLFPLLLLAGFLGLRRALGRDAGKASLYALTGAVPVLAVTAFVNFEYWPTFLPARTYAGFPHGLELILGPGAFAPAGLMLTLLVVWLATRRGIDPPAG